MTCGKAPARYYANLFRRQNPPCPLSPIRGLAQAAQRRACLQDVSARVGAWFCAAVRMAMAVDLARCSAPERVRSATPTASATKSGSMGFAVGAGGLRACSCWDHSCNNTFGIGPNARRVSRNTPDAAGGPGLQLRQC